MGHEFLNIGPRFEVPKTMANELLDKAIDDKVNGTIIYEVVGKDASGIRLRVKNFSVKNKEVRR
jgi:hypothetical protein